LQKIDLYCNEKRIGCNYFTLSPRIYGVVIELKYVAKD
jgi:hypothetical protein